MNKLFNFNGNEVRTVNRNGEPWFVLKDVCDVLEIGNPSQLKTRLDDGVISNEGIQDSLGRTQSVVIVNEDGLYDTILESRKPEAKAFRKWITSEVIPSIRKTGSYSVQAQLPQNYKEALIALVGKVEENEKLEATNQNLEIENSVQKQRLKEQEVPVAIYQMTISAQNTQSMADVAKALGTGRTRLFNILREEKVIPLGRTVPYQRYIESGYFVVRERPRASGETIVNDPVPRVTAKGFDYIARLIQKRTGA